MHGTATAISSQASKNTVREGYLARFLDIVIWGHEHECKADPWVRPPGGSGVGVGWGG